MRRNLVQSKIFPSLLKIVLGIGIGFGFYFGLWANSKTNPTFKDGTYYGESPGWTGMKVEVKIAKGKIKQVKVLEAKGTVSYYEKVIKTLPPRMVSQNTVDVEAVTGATLSSESLKQAVSNALEKAK